jgi:uncharacterized protein (TIGR02145 family)
MYLRIILIILLPLFGFSQAPQKINFQSVLRNSGGDVVSNKSVSLKISILSGSITGNTVYSETHAKTTDAAGLISLQIGNGTVFSGVFSAILWGNTPHFIKLEADFNGGSNYVLLGTQELMSVPYALYASKTDTSVFNLANRFVGKLNVADTVFMLNPYLRKTDDVIVDLQNQNKILQNLAKVTDADGNSYKTVKIGNQIWMAENLKTSKYQNGNSITTNLDDLSWSTATSGAFAIYENNPTFDTSYGKLYNWYTVSDNRGICPVGWHVPSQAEFITLREYLGGASVAGGKLKLTGTTFWLNPNIDATNESGFSAIGGGTRNSGGSYTVLNQIGFFWSSTENVEFGVVNNGAGTGLDLVSFKTIGYSVRCLKNAEGDLNQSLNLKLNISDTSTMLNPYLRKVDAMVNVETDPVFNTSIAKGITGIDTAYWNRKLNPSDTASMLTNYLRKSDAIIADLQNQDKLLQSFSNVIDIDGNKYKTIKIGSQVWMSENLKTSRYRNGGPIPNVIGNANWQALTTGAWSNYNHDTANDVIYGKLYNWYTTIGDTLCPTGWGVPTDAEYTILITYLGGESVAQAKMKVTGTTYWESPNTGSTNESGFSGLPGGYRDKDGSFNLIRSFAWFWSATEGNEYHRFLRFMFANNGSAGHRGNGFANNYESVGASIRCLKDPEIEINQSLNLKVNIADTSDMLNPYLRKSETPLGTTTGNIQYWNGANWVNLAPGQDGQTLILVNGIPSWSGAAYPTLTTSSVSSITSTSVNIGGNISSDGGALVSARGLVYGTAANPTLSNTVLIIGSGTGGFSGTISGLMPNTTYYVRAYGTNSSGTGFGNEVSFQTLTVAVPTLITTDASGITQTSVTSGGTISNDGGAIITERGIVYGTSTNPTTSNTKISSGSGTGSFSVNVNALTPNTTYHIRSYAINSAGTGYGNNITFQTTVPAVPSLTTRELINITNTTATGGGSITNDGGSSITAKGICWSTSPNPTISDSKTTDGTGTATFTSFITGLSASIIYYVRVYATNSTGTGYGNQQTFTASSTSNTLPIVTSTSVTGLTTIQATFNAEVNSQGGGTVTERGVVRNGSGNPTVNNYRITSGSGEGSYSVNITGLTGGSYYFVRAYAINNYGISYGVEIPFTTLFGLATLTTNNVIAQSITASSGGNITDNGGSAVTAKGVVWNTSEMPTLSDSRTTDGLGTGSYVSNMAALSPSTTYYVRAYATNNTGTAYGNQQIFTTTATSQAVTDIDGNTYNTVQIGNQVWMSENLKTSRYRNGGFIPYVVGNSDWQALTTGAWSYYDHDAANDTIYGKLYNWYTTRGDTLCPTGWGVPSDSAWTVLTDYLGGENVAGGKMKTVGTAYWNSTNIGVTNESGFSALPGGARSVGGSFFATSFSAYFWNANEYGSLSWFRILSAGFARSNPAGFSVGASVRCLRD